MRGSSWCHPSVGCASLHVVGGKRVTQVLSVLALLASLVPLSTGIASGEECQPFTRADLGGRHTAETTTTTGAADLLDGGRARGSGSGNGDGDGDDDTVVETTPPDIRQPNPCEYVYEMEFPILGAGEYWAGFGAPRDGGRRAHMGIDLMAPQMTPVVAVADGVVARVSIDSGTAGTHVAIDHTDGWSSWYMHLNNDSYGTDDGAGVGIRPALEVGDDVQAGELIGWVGDSGNAETTAHHLHFELHMPDGEPIDGYDSLVAAQGRAATAFMVDATQSFTEENETATLDLISSRAGEASFRPGFAGPFVDDDGTAAEAVFNRLTAMGVPTWCDEWGVRVCPDTEVTGGDAEAWIQALMDTDRDPSVAISYEASDLDPGLDRSSVVACGVTILCPDEPATYGEIAAMVIGMSDGTSVLSPQEAGATLTRIGLGGCGGPQRSDRTLTRVEFASLLMQATGVEPSSTDCTELS